MRVDEAEMTPASEAESGACALDAASAPAVRGRLRLTAGDLQALVGLAVVLVFRTWCDVSKFPPHPRQALTVQNDRGAAVSIHSFGTLEAASPGRLSWTVASKESKTLQTRPDELHLCIDGSGWWSLFVIPAGWTHYLIKGAAGGLTDIVITPSAILRNIHALGRESIFVVLVNRIRRWARFAITLACAALLVRRAFGSVSPARPVSLHDGDSKDRKARPASLHDGLKALALIPMVMDHFGRLVVASGDNTWWNCWSKFVCSPIYFFLTGGGCVARRPIGQGVASLNLLRMLAAYTALVVVMWPLEWAAVLLQHVLASMLFSSLQPGFAGWPLSAHCAFAGMLALVHPLLIMGLSFSGGGEAFMFAGAGALHLAAADGAVGATTHGAATVWLVSAQVVRALTVYSFEFAPNAARAGGWRKAPWGPTVVACALLPVQWYLLATYRRGPLPRWTPRLLASCCRWTGYWALELYAGHVVLIFAVAVWRGNVSKDDYTMRR